MESLQSNRRALNKNGQRGFSLIELLVSVAILLILVGVLAAVTTLVSQTWKSAAGGVGSFQKARAAFDALTQTLSQATLNTYYDYVDSTGNPRPPGLSSTSTFVPAGFARASELHFISGYGSDFAPTGSNAQGSAIFFQAPLGRSSNPAYQMLNSSLNAVGFYVAFTDDSANWPTFVQNNQAHNYRFRLMEWLAPTENNAIYASTSTGSYSRTWMPPKLGTDTTDTPLVLADDITLLVILPKLPPADEASLSGTTPAGASIGTLLCPYYQYDSRAWMSTYSSPATAGVSGSMGTGPTLATVMRNQVPLVDVVMVAIAPKDAIRLQSQSGVNVPAALQVPATAFQTSANLQGDLSTYEAQLQTNHVTFKVFTETVQIQGAKWSNLANR